MKILLFYLVGYVISIILMSYIIRKRQIYTTSSEILKIPFHALFSWFLVFWIVGPKILEKMDKYYFKIKIYGKREKEKQNIKEAVKLLQRYNRWRRGADVEMPRPKEIGKAIDTAIEYIKKNEKLEEI